MTKYAVLNRLSAALLLGRCNQEDQKRREADYAIEKANKVQAEAGAKRTRAVAKQARADAETRANALEDHAKAVEKGDDVDVEDRLYAGTDERERIRYEADRELRRNEKERRRNDEALA